MVNPFELYGIKEVANVTFRNTVTDEVELYLDSLQVSSLEQTSESTDHRGGRGNNILISWDYNKDVNIELVDALMSPKSLAMIFGSMDKTFESSTGKPIKIYLTETITTGAAGAITVVNAKNQNVRGLTAIDIAGTGERVLASDIVNDNAGNITIGTTAGKTYSIFYYVEDESGKAFQISIDASTFPGTYAVTMDTLVRNKETGVDEFLQIYIPLAKMSGAVNLNMESAGDAATFSMPLKVIRPRNGEMVQFKKFTDLSV